MFVINTTFCADPSVAAEEKLWCCTAYADEAVKFGFSDVIVSKVVNLDEGADAESTAVQMQCADTKLIDEWFNTAGTRLIDECRKKYGDKVLPFTTYMIRLR